MLDTMSQILKIARSDILAPPHNKTELYYTGLNGVDVELDKKLVTGLGLSIFTVLMFVLGLRLVQLASSHLRHIYCLTANRAQQNYWAFDRSTLWPWLKRNLIYAPLGRKRHNREIQLSRAHNYGTIPSRIHVLLLGLHMVGNVVFSCLLDYTKERPAILAELRGRTGILATTNIVILVIMAGRNNPLIGLLKISFDTFNLFHRWIGRLVIAESVIHVLAWMFAYRLAEGAKAVSKSFNSNAFLQSGLTGMVCLSVMAIQTLSPIRHAFYETFLTLHQLLAFFALLGIYIHLEIPQLPALPYIQLAVRLWIVERAIRFGRIIYLNHARNAATTKVVITALRGEASRLTFQLPRHVTIRPGSHVYVYLPKISLWQSHPFSVAWTNEDSEPMTGLASRPETPITPKTPNSLERQLVISGYQASKAPTNLSLICAARSGFTRKIYDMARKSESGSVDMTAYIEGPYAGHDTLGSYGTVFMFCGGAGVTHNLVQVRHLLACAHAKTVATRKIVFVWTVRDAEAFAWVRDWYNQILKMPGRREILTVLLYVTKPKNPNEFRSAGNTLKTIPGRCSPGAVLDEHLPSRVGATMVTVCGPGAFADEVRAAVRDRIHAATLDMNEEAFTW